MPKKVLFLVVFVLVLALIAGTVVLNERSKKASIPYEEKEEITKLVENFGRALQKVDKVAPNEEISKSIKENYSPFLTDGLLNSWLNNPEEALGRTTSSPWPDRIEILSIAKVDDFTAKVKGYVVWVTSGNGTLEVSEKVPIVIIVKKDQTKNKWLIDNSWSNEFAFYDGRILLKTLKSAFSHINTVGENGLPYVEKVVHTSLGFNIAVIDMQTGSAYAEYYTFMKKGYFGELDLIYFRDNQGDRTYAFPQFFAEGGIAEHEEGFDFYSVDSGLNNILYNFTFERDNQSRVTYVRVDAYRWNSGKNWFEKDEVVSEKLKDDVEQLLTPNIVRLSSLKFKEIKSDFPAIGTIAVNGQEIAFSFGSKKNYVNNPSGTINHIEVFDTKQNKVVFSTSINKSWADINEIDINDNWILFSVVENGSGAPVECFAIDRKTNRIKSIIPTDFQGKYVDVNDIALIGDYAFVSIDIFEKNGTPEETFMRASIEGRKIIEVYLPNETVETIFDETKDGYSSITNFKKAGRYVVISTAPNPTKKPPSGVSVSRRLIWVEVTPSGRIIGEAPNDLIGDNFVCTPDEYIIFEHNGFIERMPINELGKNNDHIEYLPLSSSIDPNFLDVVASSKYIVSVSLDTKSGGTGLSFPTFISVYNITTYGTNIFNGGYATNVTVDGEVLCFENHREDDTPDSIIYLNLKENGF